MPKVTYTNKKGLYQEAGSGISLTGGSLNWKRKIDSATLNTGADVTTTLTAAQSGTLFVLDGTGDLVVNMPALSTTNVGLTYRFVVVTAVGGGKTVTFVLPGSAVSNFHGLLHLTGNASTCATTHDVAGDTLTLVNSTVVGTTVELTCMTDDGTNSRWEAVSFCSPVATID
jgi:hypothetical protein